MVAPIDTKQLPGGSQTRCEAGTEGLGSCKDSRVAWGEAFWLFPWFFLIAGKFRRDAASRSAHRERSVFMLRACTSQWRRLLLPALLLMLVMVSPASAIVVTDYVTFTASNFSPTAPTDPVTGSFTITYNPYLVYIDQSAPISSFSSNIPFTTSPTVALSSDPSGYFYVGGLLNTVEDIIGSSDDFRLFISTINISPIFQSFTYSLAATGGIYTSHDVTGTVTPVPMPPSAFLLGSGLIPLAWFRRRKRLGK
jgi:hypothetical protein